MNVHFENFGALLHDYTLFILYYYGLLSDFSLTKI